MSFHIGQKVVCVDDSPNPTLGASRLTKGQIYVIRALSYGYDDTHFCVHVHGVHGGLRPRGRGERGFYPRRFRPVVERKTDISIFIEILDRETVRDPVRVKTAHPHE